MFYFRFKKIIQQMKNFVFSQKMRKFKWSNLVQIWYRIRKSWFSFKHKKIHRKNVDSIWVPQSFTWKTNIKLEIAVFIFQSQIYEYTNFIMTKMETLNNKKWSKLGNEMSKEYLIFFFFDIFHLYITTQQDLIEKLRKNIFRFIL